MIKSVLILLFFSLLLFETCSQGYIVNMNSVTCCPEGRELFVSKCGACHRLYDPSRFTAAVWDSVLIPMQGKAKINSDQKNKIYNWIIEIKTNSVDSLNRHVSSSGKR